MPSTWKGQKIALRKRTEARTSEGLTVTLVYEGQIDELRSQAPSVSDLIAGYFDVRVESVTLEATGEGSKAVMTVVGTNRHGFDGVLTPLAKPDREISIRWLKVQRDIRQHPLYNGGDKDIPAVGMPGETKADVEAWEQETDANLKRDFKYRNPKTEQVITLSANAQHLATRLARGQTSYDVYIPVVRLTSYNLWKPLTDRCGRVENPPSEAKAPAGYTYVKTADDVTRRGRQWFREQEWTGFEAVDRDIVNAT